MSHTASSGPHGAHSSSPTAPVTNSTPATWPPARPPPTWPSYWSTQAWGSSHRPGGRHVVLAVNKMDLVDYDEAVCNGIVGAYGDLADQLGIPNVTAIPLSALKGDNMLGPSQNTPWYDGPSLLYHLETIEARRA